MKQAQFQGIVNETISAIQGLLKVKGAEYAGSEDRLANFKRGATLTGCTPLQCAFIYASKHYDSISTYIKNCAAGTEQVLSEPIEGRLDDLINYCILLKALIKEGEAEKSFGEVQGLLADVKQAGQVPLGGSYKSPLGSPALRAALNGLDTYHADKRAEDNAMVSSLVQSGALIPVLEDGVLLRFEIAPEAVEFSFVKEGN